MSLVTQNLTPERREKQTQRHAGSNNREKGITRLLVKTTNFHQVVSQGFMSSEHSVLVHVLHSGTCFTPNNYPFTRQTL